MSDQSEQIDPHAENMFAIDLNALTRVLLYGAVC